MALEVVRALLLNVLTCYRRPKIPQAPAFNICVSACSHFLLLQAGSVSLTCIDMLYDWLLPMLDPDDTTQLGLTCQHLRQLVHGHVQHLTLDLDLLPTSTCSSDSASRSNSIHRHISHLPSFFSSC